MKLLFVPVLVAVLGQAGDDPSVRMKAMEEKIAKADSLQVTLDSKFESSKGKGSGTIQGTLTLGAGDKARAELNLNFMGKAMKIQMVSDGTKMVESIDGKAKPAKETTKHFRDTMTAVLARSGFSAGFLLAGANQVDKVDKEDNPLKMVLVSDFKKLKVEKIGDRDALVIQYKLTMKGADIAPTGTVWLDLKTNLPLKRVIRAEMGSETMTLTENYSNFRINPKLDDKLFELPK